ncbi:MAG: glycosyltransferase family 4 protein [Acidobacteria bacterium]|nr:glycosyltransferase family 4 protein [Acidobacteriota bacterium]
MSGANSRGVLFVTMKPPSGYTEASFRYIRLLVRSNVPVTWTAMGRGPRPGRSEEGEIRSLKTGDDILDGRYRAPLPYDRVVVHTVPENFAYWSIREPDRRRFGYTAWETDRLPHHWPPHLRRMHRLMVPSRFNRDSFERDDVRRPVHVVPHPLPEDRPQAGPLPCRVPDGHFVFYTIQSWTARKDLAFTLRAYLDAFTRRDPVTLIIKTDRRDLSHTGGNGFFHPGVRARVRKVLRDYAQPARVCLLTGYLDPRTLLRLHGRGDCYLQLAHGEGWGLGAYDAAAYGRPVIATDFGGPLDYLAPETAWLVKSIRVPVDDPSGFPSFAPEQWWAQPDRGEASRLMREAAGDPARARERGEAGQEYVTRRFSEAAVREAMLTALEW